jgi:GDP-6-deoxy-D-talose 4-dehydrogenase
VASRSDRVLVTGAAGFTGRHLCAALRAAGYEVGGLQEHGDATAGDLVADLIDPQQVARVVAETAPNFVVHLAAISFPGHADGAGIYRTNVEGSYTLLNALSRAPHPPRHVLLPSTGTVYGRVESTALDESAPTAPVSHYAASKLAMELMAEQFASSLPITIVRPFNYTGPGQKEPFLVPKIVRHFAEGAPYIELGNVDVVRDFLDVRVVAEVYRRLLEAPQTAGGTFNVCSGRGVSVREIVHELEGIAGRPMEIRVNQAFVRAGEPSRIVGSAARLESAIGPLPGIALTTTLADMLAERRGSTSAV